MSPLRFAAIRPHALTLLYALAVSSLVACNQSDPAPPDAGCQPASAELCNGLDDDCDGEVDEGFHVGESCDGEDSDSCTEGTFACGASGAAVCSDATGSSVELCNGEDDDCDGVVDEDFNLQTDAAHCGRCDISCNAIQQCISGSCQNRAELACDNGLDDDGDGLKDCADTDCSHQACGTGCTCDGGTSHESACGDGVDNDGDALKDCADTDCSSQSCGTGCTCQGGVRTEAACGDRVDNDGDGSFDCGDSECDGKQCNATAGGCLCAGGVAKETLCNDRVDNDARDGADCADQADCPQGIACTRTNGTPGMCQSNKTCG
jgi:hypothetical protein